MRSWIKWTILGLILIISIPLQSEMRAVWATSWDISTPEAIDSLVQDVAAHNLTHILAEVRFRGDALYRPNRENRTWPNPEPFSDLVPDPDFDPLSYLLDSVTNLDIDVYAWVTTFVVTRSKVSHLPENHVYKRHPEWITQDSRGRPMRPDNLEGAYLDPALPEVQDYLINVFCDVMTNYPRLSGIHLDYVRYPGKGWGHHPQAVERFDQEGASSTWDQWRAEQVTRFVRRLWCEVKNINQMSRVTAAVFPNVGHARDDLGQDWPRWLQEGIMDNVFLMAYTRSDDDLKSVLDAAGSLPEKDKIAIGLRAWDEKKKYQVSQIIDKIKLTRDAGFKGISLFSYDGMQKLDYLSPLHRGAFPTLTRKIPPNPTPSTVYGYVYDARGEPIPGQTVTLRELSETTVTDPNGFFRFSALPVGQYSLSAERGGNRLISPVAELVPSASIFRTEFLFHPFIPRYTGHQDIILTAFADKDCFTLHWWVKEPQEVAIQRRPIRKDTSPVDFQTITRIPAGVDFWADRSIDATGMYEYRAVAADGSQSNALVLERPAGERYVDIYVQADENSGQLGIEFLLTKPDHLGWSLMTMDGQVLVRKRSQFYPAGRTFETWKGVKIRGNPPDNGLYRFRVYSEKRRERYPKTVVLHWE